MTRKIMTIIPSLTIDEINRVKDYVFSNFGEEATNVIEYMMGGIPYNNSYSLLVGCVIFICPRNTYIIEDEIIR